MEKKRISDKSGLKFFDFDTEGEDFSRESLNFV